MSILKFILFFTTLIFLSLPSFAMESKILSTTLNETVSITKSGCTKSMVQKPYFASVKIEGGKINIEAKNIGSSYIYLWFGEEMEVYNLKVDLPKEVKPKTRAQTLTGEQNFAHGKYNMAVGDSITDKDNFKISGTKNIAHTISYDLPLFDGNLNLNSLVRTDFINLSELNNLTLQNTLVKYSSKAFTLDLGNVYSLNSEDKNVLKGVNLTYNPYSLNNFRAYAGLAGLDDLKIYEKTKSTEKTANNYALSFGVNNNYVPFEWLQLNTSLGGNVSLKTPEKSFFSNLTYKLTPSNNFNFVGNVKSNFENLSLYNNLYYKQDFFNKENYLENTVSYNYQNTSLLKNGNADNSFSVISKLRHESSTELTAKYLQSSSKKDKASNINLKLSNEIQKNFIKVYGQYDIKNLNEKNEKSYALGGNISFKGALPIDISYNHSALLEKNALNNENLDLSYKIFNNETFSLDLSNSLVYNFDLANNKRNSLSNNLAVSSSVALDDATFGLSLGYSKQIEDKINSDKLFFKLDSNINITPVHQVNFQTSVNKTINGNMDVSSNVSYSYSFGKSEEKKGVISGMVFEDENSNGVYDKNEKVFPKVDITVNNKVYTTDASGKYELPAFEYGDYQVALKTNTIPDKYKAVVAQEELSLSQSKQNLDFILSNKVTVKGYVYASKNKNKGVAGVQVNMDAIQNMSSDEDGYFSAKAIPGLHIFQVDYTSLPKNYTMKSQATQKVDIQGDKEDTIEFILSPIRIAKGFVHKKNDKNSKVEGVKVEVTHFEKDEIVKKEVIESDEDGEFLISDFEGDSVELKIVGAEEEIMKIEADDLPFKKEFHVFMKP